MCRARIALDSRITTAKRSPCVDYGRQPVILRVASACQRQAAGTHTRLGEETGEGSTFGYRMARQLWAIRHLLGSAAAGTAGRGCTRPALP